MQMTNLSREKRPFHLYTYLIMLYYLVVPMEDFLTGSAGKYIAIFIIFLGVYSMRWKIYFKNNCVNWCLVYLLVLPLVSIAWASDVSVAMERNVAYLLVPGLALLVGQLPFSEEEREAIVSAGIAGGLAAAAYFIIPGRLDLLYRMHEIGTDKNVFAAGMLLPLALSVKRAVSSGKAGKIFYFGCSLVFLLIILSTASRGALMGVVAFALVYGFYASKGNRLRTFIGAAGILVIVSLVVLPIVPEYIIQRLFDIQSYLTVINNGGDRIEFWRHAFQDIIPQNLPLGVGSGCAPLWLGRYYTMNWGMHSTYVTMLCEYGLFGLPVFLGLLWSLFRRKIKENDLSEAALLAGMCVIIFFLDAYPRKFLWNVIMLLMLSCESSSCVKCGLNRLEGKNV